MTFITEFESHPKTTTVLIDAFKGNGSSKLGLRIYEAFGFQSKHIDLATDHNQLEIEAFPMDKWVEFKQMLLSYISKSGPLISGTQILEKIKELESLGKPVGDAKELNQ